MIKNKNITNIVILVCFFVLSSCCFQPFISAERITEDDQGKKGNIVKIMDEITGDEITITVTMRDYEADGFLYADEYQVRVYDMAGNLLDKEPDRPIDPWINVDGEEYTFTISSALDGSWDIHNLIGGIYRVELWEEKADLQDERVKGVIDNTPYDPKDENEIMNIVQITDIHGNDKLKNVITSIESINPHFVLITGDLVDCNSEDNYNKFLDVMKDFGIKKNYSVGNHDARVLCIPNNHNYDNYEQYIGPVDQFVIDDFQSLGYVFLGFNSNDKSDTDGILNDYSGEINSSQLSWLTSTLNSLQYSDIKQFIIFMHHPVFSDVKFAGEDAVISDNLTSRDEFIDLCQNADAYGNDRVSLVLTGHTHVDGVFTTGGKDSNDHYTLKGERLSPEDSGYVCNFDNKETKFIHSISVTGNEGYRLIQLHGENALYRPYTADYGNPLPNIKYCEQEPYFPIIGDRVEISALVDGGVPGINRVVCYWSLDENIWQSIEMTPTMNSKGPTIYKTLNKIDTSSLTEGTRIYYKVMVENNHNYIDVKEKNFDVEKVPLGLDILSPTNSHPAFVGNPSDPVEFLATVDLGTGHTGRVLLPPFYKFEIKIGGKEANFQFLWADTDENYIFKISPPKQDSEGLYDLEVSVPSVGKMDVEPGAITYSLAENVNVVEVIDRSGSMDGTKIVEAKNAAKTFADRMTLGDLIGICSYSSSASTNYPLSLVISSAIIQDIKNAISGISTGGSTSIGAGLKVAYNQLITTGNPGYPRAILLMTDGLHNTNPHPDSILPNIKAANIRVYTIGLGADADADLLTNIAKETGGNYYFSPTENELVTIYNAISGVIRAESIIKTIKGSSQKGTVNIEQVDIDPSIDVVTFTVTWSSGTIDIAIKRPDNEPVSPTDTDVVTHIEETNYEIYTIENPSPGKWSLELTTPLQDPPYTITITGKTNVTLHLFTDKESYNVGVPIKIMAPLSMDGLPIINATVICNIKRPDGSIDTLLLYDDGYHDDGIVSDGVYANHYTETNSAGSYIIHVNSTGTVNQKNFSRETTKSVYVSGMMMTNLTINPAIWITPELSSGDCILSKFTINSTSPSDEIVMALATDFINDSGIISAEHIFCIPQTIVIPANGQGTLYCIACIPNNTKNGIYTGDILIKTTGKILKIPTDLRVLLYQTCDCDINKDEKINILDVVLISRHWEEMGSPGWVQEDVNKDGVINILDMILVGHYWTG